MDGLPTSSAVLVVHGIGTQLRGDTLAQCVTGLLAVCPDAELLDAAGSVIASERIQAGRMDHVRVRQGDNEVRLYEVYWADLLPDAAVEDSFSKFDLEETTWFPLLSWRAGLLPREEYGMGLVLFRTLELWLLQLGVSFGLEVVTDNKKIKSMVLDQTVADVWNYTHALAGDLAVDSPLQGVGERILDRFQQEWERAKAEGPAGAEVHVVAHSLGSVVAFHGIVGRLGQGSIQRLITIGSPLEKTRFLWAKLFPAKIEWPLEWFNFHTLSDPVSGRLKRFDSAVGLPICNRRLFGVGGLGEAHLGYFRHPKVMCLLGTGLGVQCSAGERSGPSWLMRRGIDVAVPVGTVILVLLGIAISALFFWIVVWLTGGVLELPLLLFSKRWALRFGHGWRVFWFWVTPPMYLYFFTKDGYARASTRHRRYWC